MIMEKKMSEIEEIAKSTMIDMVGEELDNIKMLFDELDDMQKSIDACRPIVILMSREFYYFIVKHFSIEDGPTLLVFRGIMVRRSEDCGPWELWL